MLQLTALLVPATFLWAALQVGAPDPATTGAAMDPQEPPGAHQGSPPDENADADSPGWSDDSAMRLAAIREEARAVLTLQLVLTWYANTQDEDAIVAETYRGHEALFSAETLQFLDAAMDRPGLDPEELRTLEILKAHIAHEYIHLRIAPFQDRLAHAVNTSRTWLPWRHESVAYRELEQLGTVEASATRRADLQAAEARVWAETLNPLRAEKEAMVRSLAVEAGYPSYVALAAEYRNVDLKRLVGQSVEFLHRTDALYAELLDQQARAILGRPGKQVTRADLRFLNRPPKLAAFFPPGLETQLLAHFLEGMGLTLTTAGQTLIRIDAAPRDHKSPDPLCVPVRVPRDVRLSFQPMGGPEHYTRVFHEAGHALHYGNITTPVYEFHHMGSGVAPEAFAELFAYAWSDPGWLKRYRIFLEQHNRMPGAVRVPLPSNSDLAALIRHRVFWDLFYLRRVAYAKLLYELTMHGGPPELLTEVPASALSDVQSDTQGDVPSDIQGVYRRLFSRAYGFELSQEESLRFRTDVDDFLLAADSARAAMLAHRLHEELRHRFGPDWYGDARAGAMLKTVWGPGRRWTGEEIVRQLGDETLTFDAAFTRMNRLLEEATQLEKRH